MAWRWRQARQLSTVQPRLGPVMSAESESSSLSSGSHRGSDGFDDDSFGHSDGEGKRDEMRHTQLRNDQYDEALELSDGLEDSVATPKGAADPANFGAKRQAMAGAAAMDDTQMRDTAKVDNAHFDEAMELSSSEDVGESIDSDALRGRNGTDTPPRSRDDPSGRVGEYSSDDHEIPGGNRPSAGRSPPEERSPMGRAAGIMDSPAQGSPGPVDAERSQGSGSGSESEEAESSAEGVGVRAPAGAYDPAKFEHLSVSKEVKDLFKHITRYQPQNVELRTELKCFIPDYLPAVGEIDPVIKIPRPDGKDDGLGLKVLDEPAAVQTDPTVLDLQLRAMSKKSGLDPVTVRSIEHADKTPREIDRWIESIKELHRSKPPPAVHYSNTMPDGEALMQVWPQEFEEALRQMELPPADIDMDVDEYARTVCALLDVPVHDKAGSSALIQSLHVLFTLYSDFKSNEHFNNNAGAPVSAGRQHADSLDSSEYLGK